MFEHKTINNINDYFIELNSRRDNGIYFYRINGYNDIIKSFIDKYYDLARISGVIIQGKIQNPTKDNLTYYEEIMGLDFQVNKNFIISSLRKWLPRLNDYQRNNLALALYDAIDLMRNQGKNENVLKNVYIKFMCWLYYKFERIVGHLGENNVPKILYEGDISVYELKMLSILAVSGCDVVLLQYKGDENYLKLDSKSLLSLKLDIPNMKPFPNDFCIKKIQDERADKMSAQRLYGAQSSVLNCTNAWIDGNGLEDFKKSIHTRGDDPNLFYNCFCRINGVEDKLTYANELYQFYVEIKNSKRQIVIVNKEILIPSMEEINSISRKVYKDKEQMLSDLSSNIKYPYNIELQKLMKKAFIDVLLEEADSISVNLNRLTNKAVYLLCWLKRYLSQLFRNWKMPNIGCFIYMGGCKNANEALFLKFLARLPVDVLILNPNLNEKCCLKADNIYEINYQYSMEIDVFPQENSDIRVGTTAYYAERELDEIMYQDSGMYRNKQYHSAVSVTLRTMYEEIAILWNQELKYRPNFNVINSVVNIPVIFSKVSGIKDGDISKYWSNVKSLITDNTFVIKNVPFINSFDENPVKAFTTEFFKNKKLLKEKIKAHKCYKYGFLREDVQNYILDKLQLLIEQKIIKGTFENGTEYSIIATVLNIKKDIIRMIQNFDFTKKNPKIIYINTTESVISVEDSILTAFLNLIGFDILFFVPTGYMSIESFFNKQIIEEHQIGEYVYDLRIPNLSSVSSSLRRSWRDILFKKGG